jgi:GTPase
LPAPELVALKERIGNLVPNSVFVSSVTEGGLDPLRHALLVAARKGTEISEIRFPAGDGRMLAEIYRGATVISQRTEDGQLVLSARLDKNIAGRLVRAGATVSQRVAGSSSEA